MRHSFAHCSLVMAALMCVAHCCESTVYGQVFGPGDPVLAIDLDGDSSFPPGEAPFNATDQDANTKYLNFGGFNGGRGTGLIVTPGSGSSVVQSIQMTSANDAPERDPTVFSLYGTNAPIVVEQNGFCDPADFTEIVAGQAIVLPDDRFAPSDIVDFTNGQSFESYLIVMDDLKGLTGLEIMQVADIQLYTGAGGTGDQILAAGDTAIACFADEMNASNFPNAEIPTNTIDGTPELKYLNFGRTNSGFIIRRADGAPVTIDSFVITTANDFPGRDPSSYEISGTNDPITSTQNSTGDEENWTLVQSGTLTLPDERFTDGDMVEIMFKVKPFTAYRVIFPTVKADIPTGDDNSMQIGEMTFSGEVGEAVLLGDVNCDGMVDLLDVSPFVDLVINGGFSAKADINQDGIVDLLDVAPFVDLLTM